MPAGPRGPAGTGDLSSGETAAVGCVSTFPLTRRRSTAASSRPGPLESDDARLPDGRGPGGSRVGALALARGSRRERRPRRAFPFRPLPGDRQGLAGGVARRLDDARRARRTHEDAAARDDGVAGHVPAGLGAREERRHRRPHLGRTRRARHRRRLVRARARRLRLSVPDDAGAARRARQAARGDHAPVDCRRRHLAEAAATAAAADHRRRHREAAHGARRDALRGRVQHGLPDGRRGARAQAGPRRGCTGGRTRPARLLDDDRMPRRS